MDRTERFYIIDRLLRRRQGVSREEFLQALEVSAATFKRDLEYLRDRLGAPIVWDREGGAYRYATEAGDGGAPDYLPGMWFTRDEAIVLVEACSALERAGGRPENDVWPVFKRRLLLLAGEK